MGHWVDRHLERLGGLLLPPRCVLCGARGQAPCIDLCLACEQSLPTDSVPDVEGPGPLRRSFAPFVYGHPVDHLVHALKYRGQLAVARVLGGLLGRRIDGARLGRDIDVIVPVPLHAGRHAERGFNQSAEIARWVALELRCRSDATLATRRRVTRPQVGLSGAERRANLAGAFAASSRAQGLSVAIVDDVLTTGTTLCELGRALREAGASSVEAWCVGRAALPKQVDFTLDAKDGDV